MRRLFVACAQAGFLLTASPVGEGHAQTTVDLRGKTPPSKAITVTSQCSTVGEATTGRLDGLLGVTSATLTQAGNLLIANTGTSEILAYDREGRFIGAVGRAGAGPGEFSRSTRGDLFTVRLAPYRGDSAVVFDAAQRRITVLDSRGKVGRITQVDSLPGFRGQRFLVETAGGDGDVVLENVGRGSVSSPSMTNPDLKQLNDSIVIMRLSADGRIEWTSPKLEDAIHQMIATRSESATPGGGQRVTTSSRVGGSRPAARLLSVVHSGGIVYHYVERTNEIHGYDRAGMQTLRVTLPALPPPAPISTPGQRQSLWMMPDGEGRVWLEVPSKSGGEREWWVLDSAGNLVAVARTPARARPLFIARDRILLLTLNSNDEELVKACSLLPP